MAVKRGPSGSATSCSTCFARARIMGTDSDAPCAAGMARSHDSECGGARTDSSQRAPAWGGSAGCASYDGGPPQQATGLGCRRRPGRGGRTGPGSCRLVRPPPASLTRRASRPASKPQQGAAAPRSSAPGPTVTRTPGGWAATPTRRLLCLSSGASTGGAGRVRRRLSAGMATGCLASTCQSSGRRPQPEGTPRPGRREALRA
jgi:hypothetical protein